MKIQERYASAVNASNLKSSPETIYSNCDVLGAYGIADRRLSSGEGHFSKHPLAVPLERMFTGDKSAADEVVRVLSEVIRKKADALRVDMRKMRAPDMARIVLGWFRHPACRVCGGHGFKIIKHTTTLGDSRCLPCNGTGKVLLELAFRVEHRELVAWVISQMEREVAMAGPAALKAIAPSLDL